MAHAQDGAKKGGGKPYKRHADRQMKAKEQTEANGMHGDKGVCAHYTFIALLPLVLVVV